MGKIAMMHLMKTMRQHNQLLRRVNNITIQHHWSTKPAQEGEDNNIHHWSIKLLFSNDGMP